MIKTLLILYINRWKRHKWSMILTTLSISISLITLSIITFHYSRLTSPIYPEYNKEHARYLGLSTTYKVSGEDGWRDLIYYKVRDFNSEIEEAVDGVAEIITFTTPVLGEARFDENIGDITYQEVSANIFNYLEFEFVAGKPFIDNDSDKAYIPAIITDKFSKKVFGTVQAVGKYIQLPRTPRFMVSGVVKEAPNSVSFNSNCYFLRTNKHNVQEKNYLFISDNEIITEKLNRQLHIWSENFSENDPTYNFSLTTMNYVEYGLRPIIDTVNGTKGLLYTLLAIFIFIPIICLHNILSSYLKYSIEELGVRRSFGANRVDIMIRLIIDNIISVLVGGVGGVGGVVLSVIVIVNIYNITLGDVVTIYSEWRMLLGSLIMFSLIGALAGAIPAYKASKQTIISSLNNR